MNSIDVTIQEVFESGQSSSKICGLPKGRASRTQLKETGSSLLKVRSTPSRKIRTPKLIKNTRERI